MERLAAWVAVLWLLTCQACSSEKTANATNFAAAIRADEQRHDRRLCIAVRLGSDRQTSGEYPRAIDEPHQAALVAAGLATRNLVSRGGPYTGGYYTYDYQYVLTELGRQYADPTTGNFCYATTGIDRVTNFTEPTENGTAKISQVRYTYKLDNVAPWARDAGIQQAFPEVATWIAGENREEKTVVLWLTANGWEVASQR